jgi:DegV family protein with EDD domain
MYKILTDSACDLSQQMLTDLDVQVVPLSLNLQGKTTDDSVDAGITQMYAALRAGATSSTSAINPDRWASYMRPILEAGQDLLVVTFSSGLSTTYQSAMIAAEELREKYPQRLLRVVDSRSGSLGEGLLLWHACRLRDAGETLAAAGHWLEEHCSRICHWVTVNELVHLKRSGRLSSAGALIGTMLDIKPIIKVTEEGKLVSDGKTRGRKASIRMLAERFAKHWSGSKEELVTIAHGDCPEDAEQLAEILRKEHGIKNILIGYVGPVLGAHTGPGVLGLFHLGKAR